jgi:hypothetical protein
VGGNSHTGQYIELRKDTGKIVLPFTAGEVNLVMQPGPSGSAAVTVLLDEKARGDVRGADVGSDGVARVDDASHDSRGRRCGATAPCTDAGDERPRLSGIRIGSDHRHRVAAAAKARRASRSNRSRLHGGANSA